MIEFEEKGTKVTFSKGYYLGCDKTEDRKFDCYLFKRGMGKRLTTMKTVGTFDKVDAGNTLKFLKEKQSPRKKRPKISDDLLLFPRPFEQVTCKGKVLGGRNILTCDAFETGFE